LYSTPPSAISFIHTCLIFLSLFFSFLLLA
jgi:hypothetical protein